MDRIKLLFLNGMVCLLMISYCCSPVFADQNDPSIDDALKTINTLQGISSSLNQVEEEINLYRKQLKERTDEAAGEELQKSIMSAVEEKKRLQLTFEEIAGGLDLEKFEEKLQFQFDWANELKELLSPILGELRAVTDRPRELERLRREVAYYQDRIPVIEKTLDRIVGIQAEAASLPENLQTNELKSRLSEIEKKWREKLQQTKSSLTASEHQLSAKLEERKSLVNSARDLFARFFRSRGLNLIISILVFVLILLGSRYFHQVMYRISPWHSNAKQRTFFIRLIDVLYFAFTIVGSVLSALIVLYILEDWVLLALAFILVFGLIWAARKGIPIFWQQAQLMLNLGSVREGEIVIIDGLPWMVESINVFTFLVNPLLKGGHKRLPIKDLVVMRSRLRAEDEPWFPCRQGDWVILSDGMRGKVVCQTPDLVELVKLGGSRKVYTTGDFLAQTPINISKGFRLHVDFGLDYAHQAVITDEIAERMKLDIKQGLIDRGHEEDLVYLNVEFLSAGASSLDLQVLADFSGNAAPRYDFLQRLINSLAVDACNRHDWIIPFTQITLHQA